MCNEKNVGSFQQNSETVKASTGGTDKVSFWFTLKVLVRDFFQNYLKKINSTTPLNKTTLKAEILVR